MSVWDDPFTFEGWHEVEFTNGATRKVNVDRNLRDGNAHSLFLVDVNEVYYNWMNIISIRKVNN